MKVVGNEIGRLFRHGRLDGIVGVRHINGSNSSDAQARGP
jgi:hypothetical protein